MKTKAYFFHNFLHRLLHVAVICFIFLVLFTVYPKDFVYAESKSTSVYDGSAVITYSGQNPVLYLNGTKVTNEIYPGYVFDNTTVFSLKYFFGLTGICSYEYREKEKLVIAVHKDCVIRFVIDSPVAYVNDTAYILPTVPRLLTPSAAGEPEIYLPAEFTLKALGYRVARDTASFDLTITNAVLEPRDNIPIASKTPEFERTSYKKELFSYSTYDQLVFYQNKKGYAVPEKLLAYSCKNSDAIYFQGITEDQLTITDTSDLLEITVSGSFNPFGNICYYEPENNYLSYFGIKNRNNFTVNIFKTTELHYYTYTVTNGCVLHITDSLDRKRDRLVVMNENDLKQCYGEIVLAQSTKELLPPVIVDRGFFTIQLPAKLTSTDISFEDDYLNSRLIFKLPGNQVAFLAEQELYNPVKTVQDVSFQYNVSENKTYMIITTTKIQGCKYTVEGNILSARIDDPRELYDKIVVLDAGHGGIDPGTSRNSILEKNINFTIVNQYLADLFQNSDIKVYFTRNTDTKIALEQRAAMSAEVGADFFISVHINANNSPLANGTSVYYSSSNNTPNAAGLTSKILAGRLLEKLTDAMGTRNAGLLTAKFVVIHENTVPAALVELAFITNDADFKKIKDTAYQKKAAKAIYEVINEIFQLK